MADPVQDLLDRLNTSNRVRAAAWDAVYASKDSADFLRRLEPLPFAPAVKAQLWDLRFGQGTTLPAKQGTASPDQELVGARARGETWAGPPPPEGSATRRLVSNAWEGINPVNMATGLYQLGRHPVATLTADAQARASLRQKAETAPTLSERVGYRVAGSLPFVGPNAAHAGQQFAAGDIAGGLGNAVGQVAAVAGPGPKKIATTVSRRLPARTRTQIAGALERSAEGRVAEVMSPTVGPNKTRFGNQAEEVAPQLARNLARDGAPWTREGYQAQIGDRLATAEQGLDAATDARLAARTFETQPIINDLLERRRELTAEAVTADRRYPQYEGAPARAAHLDTEFRATHPDVDVSRSHVRGYRTLDEEPGRFAAEPTRQGVPVGQDVVPGPNAARVAVIDQAIAELRQLGPVTRYEPIRRIRQAYDGPAKAVYSPSMTADYLKAHGGKLGAADVTGTLRTHLAQWDPATAAANVDYHLYRTASDVLEATREVERTRPRVGRLIVNRLMGTIAGGQAAGPVGAAAGYLGAPLLDAGVAMGATTKLKVARLQMQLANAIRGGDVPQVTRLAHELEAMRTLAPRTGLMIERLETGTPEATAEEDRRNTPAGPAPDSSQARSR